MPIQIRDKSAPLPQAGPIAYSRDWRLRLVVAAIGVTGIGLSIVAAVVTHRAITKEAQRQFDALCQSVFNQTVDRINRIGRGLNGARSLFATGIAIDRAIFKAYVEARDFQGEFPGAMGMGLIERVAREDLDSFIRKTRADGEPTFGVQPLELDEVLSEPHRLTYPIKYIFPLEPNRPALGTDLGSEGGRRRAIERAIDSGQPTITRRIELLQARGRAGFLYFLPVYRVGTHPRSPEERRRDLLGLVYSPVVLDLALVDLLPERAPFDVRLTDRMASTGNILLDLVSDHVQEDGQLPPGRFRYVNEAVVGGRSWLAEFQSNHHFDYGSQFLVPPMIGAGGTALTALVCGLLLVVGGRRDRAIALAEQMTAELRASERKARAVFDQTFQFIGLLDRDGRIIEANQAALGFAGVRAEAVIGKYFPDTPWWSHSPEIQEQVRRAIAAALRGELVRFETTHPGADGKLHYVDFSLKPVVDDKGKVMWLLPEGRDISDIKKIQEAYKAAKEAAESASRFKSEFIANMSHEIRTPMTAILGFADLLPQMISGESAEVVDCVNVIRRNGDHLMGLINDILDLSKIEAGEMTVERIAVDPRQILMEVESLMGSRARDRGLELDVEIATDIPALIRSDPVKIKQILINLVANAVKFTERGAVTIRAGYVPDSPYGPALTLAVSDTGIGILPEHMPRLFEAFQQADGTITRKFGGTGLGLRISRALAKLLGGEITVTSEPGKGSTFTVSIATGDIEHVPMIPRDALRKTKESLSDADEREAGPRRLQGIRIVLAEDSLPIQKLIAYHLSRAGADVRVFANGLAALRSLSIEDDAEARLADPLPCDLLITDIQMPEMDGYTLARTLRSKGATLPIIGLTAHATPEDAAACIEAGCDRYATKPIDPVALITLCSQSVSGLSLAGLGARQP